MPPTPATTMRLTREDHQAIQEVAEYLRSQGMLGFFYNDGDVNTTAIVRYAVQQLYMEVRKQKNEAAKPQQNLLDEE